MVPAAPHHGYDAWRHRFASLTVGATQALIFIGGLVTSTGSALAVPDWPLSYGMLMPPMVGGIFYEHGHRMAASAVGMLTLALAVWTARAERRRGVRRLGWACLLAVVTQGLLGGLTVLLLLPTSVSVAHACLAQTFFCLTIALAYVTSREWLEAPDPMHDQHGLRPAAVLVFAAVYVQLAVGAIMRHTDAGLAIPTFPLAFGRLVPAFDAPGVAIHFTHRLMALVVTALAIRLYLKARASEPLARPCAVLLGLLALQVTLGAITVLTAKAVTPTTLHVATGATVLGSCWFIVLRAFRMLRPAAPAAAGIPVAATS